MATQRGMKMFYLEGSGGPPFVVNEAEVVASWVEDGKSKVRLLGCEGKVFEVDKVVDLAALPAGVAADDKFKFKSWDGVVYEVDMAVAMHSLTLRSFWQRCTDSIPVVSLKSKVLDKVMEYCEKHAAQCNAEELRDWDAEFVRVNQAMLNQYLLEAAYYLNIKGLQVLVCRAIADMMDGKTPEVMRKIIVGFQEEHLPST